MAEFDSIPPETKTRIEQVGKADIVIGLLSGDAGAASPAVEAVRTASSRFVSGMKTVIVQSGANAAASEPSQAADVETLPVDFGEANIGTAPEYMSEAYRILFRISEGLSAAVCGAIVLESAEVTPDMIHALISPVLDRKADLVVPLYAHRKFDGLINTGILYPVTRALYGRRIRYPMSSDLSVSARLIAKIGERNGSKPDSPIAWIPLHAVRGGLDVAQAPIGARPSPPKAAGDLSSVLTGILGSLFLDIERHAGFWQKTRASQPVPSFGAAAGYDNEAAAVNPRGMMDTFQLGFRNLMGVWSPCLPPATLLDLKRLTRATPEQFRMADSVWARIVYDFALAHRLRTISRDHLLRAITPLYLAWVASWVMEMSDAGQAQVEARIERLCTAFEQERSYFVARWRWPDRFNP